MRLALIALVAPVVWADTTQLLRTAPIRFEENRGQMAAGIRYAARGLGYSLLFFDQETLLRLGERTVRMTLEGASATPIEGLGVRSATNYFRGARRLTAPAYSRVRRVEAWPGIDVIYYGSGDRLEFDFVVKPGANPGRIRMRFRGADAPHLNEAGELLLGPGLVEQRPRVYASDGAVIESRYQIQPDGAVAVALGPYDPQQTLVVDPVLVYSAYLSGAASDGATQIALDNAGNVYVGGYTYSTDFLLAGDSYSGSNGGSQDIFVLKLNPALPPNQVVVYSTYLGGAATDELRGMAVDSSGNIYLTGQTNSNNFPTTAGALQTTLNGNADAFLVRLDPSKSGADGLVYSTYLGGGAVDSGQGLALGGGGIVYIAGATQSTDFPLAGKPIQDGIGGSYDAFVAKIDTTRSGSDALVASTYLGGDGYDAARGVAVDAAGKVYITGVTYSTSWPRSGDRLQQVYHGVGDAFVAKLDLITGNLDYSTHFGGGNYDEGRKILVDPGGQIVVAGFTLSQDLAVTQNALQAALSGISDVFVAIINPDRSGPEQLVYSTFFGGSDGEVVYDLRRDAKGRLWIAGYTLSRDFPTSPDALQKASAAGGIDGFVAAIDPASTSLAYGTYLTSKGFQVVYALEAAADGTLYIAGSTTGSVFDGRLTPVGGSDAFLLVMKP